jgi:hypothetical protein
MKVERGESASGFTACAYAAAPSLPRRRNGGLRVRQPGRTIR